MSGEASMQNGAPVVVTVADEFVLESAEPAEQMRELLRAGRCRMVLDLRQAAYVSAIGLGLVADALKQARHAGGDVKIVVGRPELRRIFELGELSGLLEFYEDVESARRAFADSVGEVERTLLWQQFSHE
jgi:anti-sigma B factor antagonist